MLVVLALAASACGGSDDGPSAAGGSEGGGAETEGDYKPVTIENCGETTTYDTPPERAVPLDQNVTEMMLALGLEDRIVGYARQHFSPDQPVLPEFKKAYDKLELLAETTPAREVFLEVAPDFALAPFVFEDDSGLSREALADDDIPTYLLPDQCPGRTEPVTLEDTYTTIRDLGAIFGVPDRAEAVVKEMEANIEEATAPVEGEEPVQVFIYDSGDDAPFTVGGSGMSNALIEEAGGENIFGDVKDQFADGSWEEVLSRDPDVIVIMDYKSDDDRSVDAKRDVLDSRVGDTTAVKEDQVVALQLTGFFLSVRNDETIASLVKALHG